MTLNLDRSLCRPLILALGVLRCSSTMAQSLSEEDAKRVVTQVRENYGEGVDRKRLAKMEPVDIDYVMDQFKKKNELIEELCDLYVIS